MIVLKILRYVLNHFCAEYQISIDLFMKLKNKSLKPNLYILFQVQTVNCARIVKSNILSSNGVIHLVDQV